MRLKDGGTAPLIINLGIRKSTETCFVVMLVHLFQNVTTGDRCFLL